MTLNKKEAKAVAKMLKETLPEANFVVHGGGEEIESSKGVAKKMKKKAEKASSV